MKKSFISFGVLSILLFVLSIPAKTTTKNLLEIANESGQFTILTKAIEAAGLVDVMNSKGKFTVFAPTDEAFRKLPKGTLESLLKPENKEKLKAILLFHIVKTELSAKKVIKLNGRQLVTAEGSLLKIDASNGVKINNANVIKTDIEADNGVIHLVDTVLIPVE